MKIRDVIFDDAEIALNCWLDRQRLERPHALSAVRDILKLHTSEESAYIAAHVATHVAQLSAHEFCQWIADGMPDAD